MNPKTAGSSFVSDGLPATSPGAFHALFRKWGIPDPKTGNNFSDFAENLLTKYTELRTRKLIQVIQDEKNGSRGKGKTYIYIHPDYKE